MAEWNHKYELMQYSLQDVVIGAAHWKRGYWYLASPYSKYPRGTETAFKEVSKIAGDLILAGVPAFCPIAHSTPIVAAHGPDIDTHDVWLPFDEHLMRGAVGCIVAMMDTWDTSHGVTYEREYFNRVGKPIMYLGV